MQKYCRYQYKIYLCNIIEINFLLSKYGTQNRNKQKIQRIDYPKFLTLSMDVP
jgi:hypothetical protein